MEAKMKISKIKVGRRFGRWKVVSPREGYSKKVRCVCQCGYETDVGIWNLINGTSTQCVKCQARSVSAKLRRSEHKCVDCGGHRSPGAVRCKPCRDKYITDKPTTYPVSTGTLAREYGLTRQRICQMVKEHGWDGAMASLKARKR